MLSNPTGEVIGYLIINSDGLALTFIDPDSYDPSNPDVGRHHTLAHMLRVGD